LFQRIIKYLSYLFLAYLFVGFFILPLLLKPQLLQLIQNETKTKASMEALSFNPLIFSLEIKNLELHDLHDRALFSFDTLTINLNPSSLFYGALELKELSLISPKLYVVYNKDKSVNLLNVLKSQKSTKQEPVKKDQNSTLPRIIVEKIKLEDGRIYYKDYSRTTPFEFSLENIGFSLIDFDTKKITQNSAGLRLYSRLGDGGFVDFKSRILSITPLKLEGSLGFEASKLYTEWKYMQDVLRLEVADGKVSFEGKYKLNLDELNATKIYDLNLALEKLRIKPKNEDRDILNLDTLYVKNAFVLPLQQSVTIEKIGLYDLRVKAKRYANGKIDWLEYLASTQENNTTQKVIQKKEQEQQPWQLLLHSLALEKIALQFQDEAIEPHVTTNVNKLDIYMQNLTLEGKEPFDYQISAQLNKSGFCDMNGSLRQKRFTLAGNVACRDIDIAHYRPYIDAAAQKSLKKYDLSLEHALVDISAKAELFQDANESYNMVVADANLSLKQLLLRKKSTRENVLAFQGFNVKGVHLSTAQKEILVSDVSLNRLLANLVRNKENVLNINDIVIPKKSQKKEKMYSKKEQSYSVKVKHIALNDAKIAFLDKALEKAQKHTLDRININVNNFDIQKRSWLQYTASMRVNKKGKIKARGKLRHTPLKQNGSIDAKKISLTELTPYLQTKSYVSVDDGALSFSLKESYAKSKKYPDLRMHGELSLNSLFISDTHDVNASLFSLNELRVHPFTLELFPNRLYVDAVDIDSFYVAAKIDENKTINFAKLMKQSSAPLQQADNNTTLKETQKTEEKNAFPVKIVKLNVKNGSAEFRDFSLPIKFKTNIHDLQGGVYAISSSPGDTTYVDISGEVDKYGSTKLKGSVDSFNPKEYTDLNFNFKNLDLHSMSGYSASFAGYEIASGKLYLDLGYEIMHSKLNATNNIMIKKIKLGKELEGDNINHLPLGFVIGLLEDNEGIIDIDMPIEGNVDEPDFKYGVLVWKTLGNLIAKAVTSPFKFLGSMMGLDGEELEFVAFEFGSSTITPPQREKLDKIVKLMRKRPKITLKVDAVYDEKDDLKALKLQKLVSMVMKISGEENIKNAKTALNVDILEDVYDELRDDDKADQLKEKLEKEHEDEKEFDRAYQNALIELCTEIQPVSKEELMALAKKRAENIQTYLVQEKSLEMRRVLQGEVKKLDNSEDGVVKLTLNIEVQSSDK